MTDIVAVAAMSENRVIGSDGSIPWDVDEDKKHFKNTVESEVVVVGRKTYESSPVSKFADEVILMSRSDGDYEEDVTLVNSTEEALEEIEKVSNEKVYNSGGAEIYKELLDYTDEIILSIIPGEYEGDSFFPQLNPDDWSIEKVDEREDFEIVHYKKI